MKALSIKEPWASMILSGKKTIETRTWKTKYRGSILLCASKNPESKISGMAFATAELISCLPMNEYDEEKSCCEVYPGAYSWFLENVKKIKPFPVKGQLRIFEVKFKCGNCEEVEVEHPEEWCEDCNLPERNPQYN